MIITRRQKKRCEGRTLHDLLHEGLMRRTACCATSERQEGKRERQLMLPLVLLIKFVLLLIIFQVSFSFNLLVANWRLSLEF